MAEQLEFDFTAPPSAPRRVRVPARSVREGQRLVAGPVVAVLDCDPRWARLALGTGDVVELAADETVEVLA